MKFVSYMGYKHHQWTRGRPWCYNLPGNYLLAPWNNCKNLGDGNLGPHNQDKKVFFAHLVNPIAEQERAW